MIIFAHAGLSNPTLDSPRANPELLRLNKVDESNMFRQEQKQNFNDLLGTEIQARSKELSVAEVSGIRPTILVVDDEPSLRLLISRSLSLINYNVITAANGVEALDLFARHQVDLVLLDLMMPVMDGFTTCAEIRKQSTVPVVILSCFSRSDVYRKVEALGADAYLTKPVRVSTLRLCIQPLLTSRPLSQSGGFKPNEV